MLMMAVSLVRNILHLVSILKDLMSRHWSLGWRPVATRRAGKILKALRMRVPVRLRISSTSSMLLLLLTESYKTTMQLLPVLDATLKRSV